MVVIGHRPHWRLIGRGRVGHTEVQAKDFPSPLVVHHDGFGTDVSMKELDGVVQEGQSFTELEQNENDRETKNDHIGSQDMANSPTT